MKCEYFVNTFLCNLLGYDTARNMGIGTVVYGTVCTYTQSDDVAPLRDCYILHSQVSSRQGQALERPSLWGEGGVREQVRGGDDVDVLAPQ